MKNGIFEDSYINQVLSLVNSVHPAQASADSILTDTTSFFINDAKSTRTQLDLKIDIAALQDDIAFAEAPSPEKQKQLNALINQLEMAKQEDDNARHQRLTRVRKICQSVYEFCEGESLAESQAKTAKFMAALWLISEQNTGKLQRLHQRLKAPYKIALTLRLVDRVIQNQLKSVPNWQKFESPEMRFKSHENQQEWFATVAMPAMVGALFQDSGLQHPLALRLLHGKDGKADPFRVLTAEERQSLLKMNYRFSVDYVTLGLGVDYATDYASPEQQVLAHATTLELVKDAYKPKSGIGEILKIPQIYTSVVLSTKPDVNRENVPKSCLLIDQLGKKGVLNANMASEFHRMTGIFPQGFGVVSTKHKSIVLGLYPPKPHEPHTIPLLSRDDVPVNQKRVPLAKAENQYFTDSSASQQPSPTVDSPLVKSTTQTVQRTWLASEHYEKWMRRWQKL